MKEVKPLKIKTLQYSITFGVCLLLCFLYCLLVGIFSDYQAVVESTGWNITNNTSKVFYILSNAFFVIGVLCACAGLLVVASNGGAFEMLVYGVRRFFSLFKKDPTKVRFKTFYDYHVYRSEVPKKSFLFLLLVGLFYISLSILFVFIYYQTN